MLRAALPRLRGASFSETTIVAVERFLARLPGNARVAHVGFAVDAGLDRLRLCVAGLDGGDLRRAVVEPLGLTGDLRALCLQSASLGLSRFVGIDFMEGLWLPRVGVELHMRRAAQSGLMNAWRELCGLIDTLGLGIDASPLSSWHGVHEDEATGSSVLRIVTHFKLTVDGTRGGGRYDIKAYLGCLPQQQRDEGKRNRALAVNWPVSPMASICVQAPRQLMHGGFLRACSQRPDAVAVITRTKSVTYGDLRSCAENLATRLVAAGAGANEVVAILCSRGVESIVAMLGTLLAGAAYLPIEEHWPQSHVDKVLAQARCRLAVIDDDSKREAARSMGIGVLTVAAAPATPDANAARLPVADADSLAYVIFTSGTTGAPKGVAITHRAVANTIADINDTFKVGASDRSLCVSSLGFDLSVYDVFGLLAAGGAVVMTTDSEQCAGLPDFEAIWDLATLHRVTVWNSVPALMELLLAALAQRFGADGRPTHRIRLALLSGDFVASSLPARLRKLLGDGIEVVSLGGATEAAIWSIMYRIESSAIQIGPIPYGGGESMRLQQVYVLDRHLSPCPIGEPGEIYIGGAGLATGYLYDSAQTAERFVHHPAGARLFRTGDGGYYRDDGLIMITGRLGGFVKIGGHRIETAQVEAELLRQPGVHQCAVVAVNPPAGGRPKLAAYFVGPHGYSTDEDAARHLVATLSDKLPRYMVPGVRSLVRLDALPLTDNGKVDRVMLSTSAFFVAHRPRPAERDHYGEESLCDGLGGDLQQQVAESWREVLAIDIVCADDDFFDLGGDSFAAVRVTMILSQSLGVTIPSNVAYRYRRFGDFTSAMRDLVASAEHKESRAEPSVSGEAFPVVVTPLAPCLLSGVLSLYEEAFATVPRQRRFTRAHLAEHVAVFASGQLVALHGGQVVGALACLRIDEDLLRTATQASQVTGDDTFSTHRPEGSVLFVEAVAVDRSRSTEPVEVELLEAVLDLVREGSGVNRIAGAASITGYPEHQDAMSAETYVARVVAGELVDPILSVYLMLGFRVNAVLQDFDSDARSDNWSVLIDASPRDLVAKAKQLRATGAPARGLHYHDHEFAETAGCSALW
ncbi:MAG: amino acid adenylation domain-containing protein [Methylococcus sp.]